MSYISGWGISAMAIVIHCCHLPEQSRFKWHECRQTPLIIYENVRGCPKDFLEDNLPSFTIVAVNVDPWHANSDHISRPRTYFICWHVRTATLLYDIQEAYDAAVAAVRSSYKGPGAQSHEIFSLLHMMKSTQKFFGCWPGVEH